jgi:hypothetical protein
MLRSDKLCHVDVSFDNSGLFWILQVVDGQEHIILWDLTLSRGLVLVLLAKEQILLIW